MRDRAKGVGPEPTQSPSRRAKRFAVAEPQRARLNRAAVMIAIAVAAGLGVGFLLVPQQPSVGETEAAPPAVELLGAKLTLDDGAAARALDAVRRHVRGTIALELPGGERQSFSFGELGVEIDKVRLAQLVRDARDATSPLRRVRRRSDFEEPVKLPVPLVVNESRALPALLRLKDEHDRTPIDARLDLEKRELVHEKPGRYLDVDATVRAVELALGEGERTASVVFEERRPKRVAAELGAVEFDHVLGFFETGYSRAQRHAARTFNLRLAASKLDGYVLLPGETFDFNEVVGPRDEANGYKVAPVIAEGELVDGIGGGTCQISGTLHGAAFFAGLEIVERYPHTRPSSYIKMGLDATVVYPTINFRLRNSFDFPIVFHEVVKNGVVRAEVLGPKRDTMVTLIRRIDSAIAYEELERLDENLPDGKKVLAQRGIPGFRLHRYRILRNGEHAVRQRWSDVYPPTAQIIRVGTGPMPPDSVRASDDPHPEYVADELLVVTQGPGVGAARPGKIGMREEREKGKYGRRGWTDEEGMPLWRGNQ